ESWQAISTGLVNLDVRALAIDPVNAATIYVGSRAGVSKSTDGGASWRQSGLPGRVTVALAIDFASPNILYAGIVLENRCFYFERRLFKTTDGGASWSDGASPPINGCDNLHALALDPTNPNTVYLANYDDVNGDTLTPLIKSTDSGATWIPLYGPPFAA